MNKNQEAVVLLNAAKADGRIKVFNGAAKYRFLMNLNEEAIPMEVVSEVHNGPKGKPIPYGSMAKINVADPDLGGIKPFAHQQRDKFKAGKAVAAFVGIYEAIDDIVIDGVLKVRKNDISTRVNFV